MKLDNSVFREVPFDKNKDMILFFSPDAYIVPHFAGQVVLAKTMQELGYQTLFVRCGGDFSRCVPVDSKSSPYNIDEKTKLTNFCSQCTNIFDTVVKHYGLSFVSLNQFITPEMRQMARELAVSALENPPDLIHDSSKIGKLCGIDFTLILKHGEIYSMSDEQKAIWTLYNENCLLSYFAVDKMCEILPVKRICVFNIYSLWMAAGLVAKKRKLPLINTTMAAHLSIDYRRYIILPQAFTNEIKKSMIRDWYRWRDIPIDSPTFSEIAFDLLSKQAGKAVQHYSPGRQSEQPDLYEQLNLSRSRKLMVAYPSSVDELMSIQLLGEAFDQPFVLDGNPFASQVEWLKALVRFTEESEDLQLVIRIHPREAANKRESVVSLQLSLLKEALSGNYKHCRVIWPQEEISSYDLAEIADLGLTSWSSMGLEFARLGIPALTCARYVTFVDDDFLRWGGESEEEYFSELQQMLEARPSKEKIIGSFRAYHYAQLSHSVLLDDVIPHADFRDVPQFRMPREAKAIEDVFIKGTRLVAYNRKRLLAVESEEAKELEMNELEKHLRRTIHFYFTGEIKNEQIDIVAVEVEPGIFEDVIQKSAGRIDGLLLFSRKDRQAHYVYQGKHYQRFSPLVLRLAELVEAECAVQTPAVGVSETSVLSN